MADIANFPKSIKVSKKNIYYLKADESTNFASFQHYQGMFLEAIPDVCPRCKISTQPTVNSATVVFNTEYYQVVFKCTHCHKLFTATYKEVNNRNFKLIEVEPHVHIPREFSKTMMNVSKDFIEIYNQARFAEEANLDRIAGMGYRKAVEFLLKDYVFKHIETKINSNDKDKMSKMYLSVFIEQYITNNRIKELSKRIAWLGNDETHYVKLHLDKDINDLKKLIDLSIYFIESEILAKESIAEIKPKK